MKRLLIHATVVTMNPDRDVIEDGAIYINNDRIQEVGATVDLLPKYSSVEVVDCTDRVMQTVSEADVIRDSKAAADSLTEPAGTASLKRRPWRSLAT